MIVWKALKVLGRGEIDEAGDAARAQTSMRELIDLAPSDMGLRHGS